mmetsp:Transcript_8765/g.30930  ORF Transcript_8765/g.30930 Transcript_8765/m.30930 type:complete len:206 (+) Transcript_8765:33-650(+)
MGPILELSTIGTNTGFWPKYRLLAQVSAERLLAAPTTRTLKLQVPPGREHVIMASRSRSESGGNLSTGSGRGGGSFDGGCSFEKGGGRSGGCGARAEDAGRFDRWLSDEEGNAAHDTEGYDESCEESCEEDAGKSIPSNVVHGAFTQKATAKKDMVYVQFREGLKQTAFVEGQEVYECTGGTSSKNVVFPAPHLGASSATLARVF